MTLVQKILFHGSGILLAAGIISFIILLLYGVYLAAWFIVSIIGAPI